MFVVLLLLFLLLLPPLSLLQNDNVRCGGRRLGVRRSEVVLRWWSRCCRSLAGMSDWVGVGEPQSAARQSRCLVGWRPTAGSVARQYRDPIPSRSCWSVRTRSRCGHPRRRRRTRSAARLAVSVCVSLVVRLRKRRLCRECCRRRCSMRTRWRWHTGCRGGCSWTKGSPAAKGGRN